MSDHPSDLHQPVLLARCVELLAPALQRPGSVVVDATLGMGGHSEALLRACPNDRLRRPSSVGARRLRPDR
jgi:16S rRNA (cytosine1402-N4)-methyltransferase